MEENNIDKYFKDALATHAETPSSEVWDRIDSALVPEGEDKGAPILWRGVALLSLGLLLLISGLFWWRMDKLDREKLVLEQELANERLAPLHQDSKSESSYSMQESNVTESQAIDQESHIAPDEYYVQAPTSTNSNSVKSKDEKIIVQEESVAEVNSIDSTEPAANPEINEPVLISTYSYDEDQGQQRHDSYLDLAHEGLSEHQDMAILDYRPSSLTRILAQPVLDTSGLANSIWICGGVRHEPYSRWYVGMAAFQNTTFRRIQSQSPEDDQVKRDLDRAEQSSASIGARGYLGYKLGKRFSIAVGLDYSTWQQSGTYRAIYQPTASDIEATLAPADYSFESELITSTSSNDVLLQATFDPGTAPWTADPGALPLATYSVAIYQEEQISFLSIPVSLRYQTYPKRLGLQAGVGLAYDLMLNSSRETTVSGDFNGSTVTSTDYQKDGFISAQAELGLFYRISERSRVWAGPRFKSWVVPLYENDGLRTYPYSNSIEVGVEIGL